MVLVLAAGRACDGAQLSETLTITAPASPYPPSPAHITQRFGLGDDENAVACAGQSQVSASGLVGSWGHVPPNTVACGAIRLSK